MTHALLSASGASKWMNCTPSARLEEQFPESSSAYAEEGTLAHKLAEVINAYNFRKATGRKITKAQKDKDLEEVKASHFYNKGMQEYIDAFCGYVQEVYNEAKSISEDAVIALEERIDFSEYVPEGYGTGDVVIAADGLLVVIDLKYGLGVKVSATWNKQMMLYALGAINKYSLEYGFDVVRMVVYQPRLDNVSEWSITVSELMEWAQTELKQKADLAYDGAGEFNPGEHCRFCKAKAVCRARAEENLRLAAYDFKASDTLEDDEISDILTVGKRLSDWVKDVEAYALDQAVNNGKIFHGFKVVEGKSNRIIPEPDVVASALLEQGYTNNDIFDLKGIGKLEKLLGKKEFDAQLGMFVVKPQGKPTLVPETDNRPAITGAAGAAEDFAGVCCE